ncbi:MAG: O-antigen ligase family protein [Solirubrobacterales bacterium]
MLWAGTVLCAALAAAGLVVRDRRTRYMLLAAALVLAPILVIGDNWDSGRVADLRDRPAFAAVGLAAALAALYLGALVIRARPALLVPLLVAALPFRIPVDLGGGSSNLLLPLYAVIAVGVIAALMGTQAAGAGATSGASDGPGSSPSSRGPLLRYISLALAVVLVLYALQSGLAEEISPAVQNVGFFLVPFAALFALLAEQPLDGATLRRVLWVLAIEGVLLALVAGYQYAARDLFWNDKVIAGNEAHPYFRVNSLFFDPNIFGRYLAISMVALATVVAYGRRRAELIGASVVFAILLAALVVTYSQSSTIALIAGMLVLIAARWGIAQGVGAGIAAVLLVAAAIALISGGGLTDEDSSGRKGLIEGGVEMAKDEPLLGVGSGAFADEFKKRYGAAEGFAAVSHTEPITVLAEQGVVGFAAYLAFLAVTIGGLVAALGPRLAKPARGPALAAALTGIYAVLLVHSLGYAAFFTDPVTWAVLAFAAGTLVPLGERAPRSGGEETTAAEGSGGDGPADGGASEPQPVT